MSDVLMPEPVHTFTYMDGTKLEFTPFSLEGTSMRTCHLYSRTASESVPIAIQEPVPHPPRDVFHEDPGSRRVAILLQNSYLFKSLPSWGLYIPVRLRHGWWECYLEEFRGPILFHPYPQGHSPRLFP